MLSSNVWIWRQADIAADVPEFLHFDQERSAVIEW
jgi:hypothetical protein